VKPLSYTRHLDTSVLTARRSSKVSLLRLIPSLIELMCLEETLTNLITDPKGQETPQELLKKALDIFRGIRGK
jgi:hypothetical protein